MNALVLYVATAIAILAIWSRWVRRISPLAAIALVLLPMCVTGRALLTGRVYGPIDLPFMAEPLHSVAGKFGIGAPHNGVLSDVYAQMIPWQQAVRDAWLSGTWPLLNRFMLCGDILAGALQPGAYDPLNLLALTISAPSALTYGATMTFFLAAFSMFAFARAIELREEAALVAAAAWMFSAMLAFFVEWPLSRAWAYLPLVLAAVRFVVHAPRVKSALLLMIALVLLILTGHPETLLHITAIAACYGVLEIVALRTWRPIAFAAAAGALALLLTAFALLPFFEAAPQTHDYGIRTGIWKHTTWPAMPDVVKRRVASSFLPAWGGQPWRGTVTPDFDANNWRVGSVVLGLALLALVWAWRRRETWFFAGVAVVCAWAGANALPVARILHALPLFDVALNERLAYAAAFALALLAGIAADAWRPSIWSAAAVLPLAIAALWPPHSDIAPLVALALLLAIKTPARIALPILCALVLIQRAAVDGGIYPVLPRDAFYPTVNLPKETKEPFRIAGLHFTLIPNGATMYGLEDVRGYSATTFERLYATYPLWSTPQAASFNVVDDPKRPFLSFLNVRYFLDGSSIEENRNALPRASVPREIRFEKSALPSMLEASDFRNTAWIEVPEQSPTVFDNARGTAATTRAPNGLDLDVRMDGDGWVVVSETAWPGWRAYVDGRRVRWRFANHAFLGVYVPKGAHRVRLRYLPDSFVRGRAISLATLVALAIVLYFRRQKTTPFSSSAGA